MQGYQLGKQEWIGRHGEFRYLSIETTEVDVRRYNQAGHLTLITQQGY